MFSLQQLSGEPKRDRELRLDKKNDKALAVTDQYPGEGVNEMLRLHLNRFTHKMDNAQMSVDVMGDDPRWRC